MHALGNGHQPGMFKGIVGEIRMRLGNWVGIRLKKMLNPVPVTFHSVLKRKTEKLELLE